MVGRAAECCPSAMARESSAPPTGSMPLTVPKRKQLAQVGSRGRRVPDLKPDGLTHLDHVPDGQRARPPVTADDAADQEGAALAGHTAPQAAPPSSLES